MPLTISAAQTIDGIANSRSITGTGNIDDLASAANAAAAGITRVGNTLIFDAGGSASAGQRIYALHGLQEQRAGVYNIIVRNGAHVCFGYDNRAGEGVILGTVANANGIATSVVNVSYENTAAAFGDVFQTARGKCAIGLGAFTHNTGAITHEPGATSNAFDIWKTEVGAGAVSFDAVHIFTKHNHFLMRSSVSTTARTRVTIPGTGQIEAAAALTTIQPVSTTTGVLWLDGVANTTCRVLNGDYANFVSYNGDVTSTLVAVDPVNTYPANDARQESSEASTYKGKLQVNRTVKVTFKDNLGAPINTAKLVTVDGAAVDAAAFDGAASKELVQSTKAANTKFYSTGVGFADAANNPYPLYMVAFGYAAQRSVNVKTEHSGIAGLSWAATVTKSPLVTSAYAAVVTAPFVHSTATDTLTVSANATTQQAAEYLFKLAYDNATDAYWRTRNHTPATLSNGQIDFGSLKVVVSGGTLSGTAFKTSSTVTTTGTGAVTAAIEDANGNSTMTFDSIDSWKVYSDAARTVQLGAGTVAAAHRFVYAAGTTYYLRLTVAGEVLDKTVMPTAKGVTAVSLSQVALLSAIKGQIEMLPEAVKTKISKPTIS